MSNNDALWWLRLLLVAVVGVLSAVFGIEPGIDLRTATVGDLVRVIVETTDDGIVDRGGVLALAEYVDESTGESANESLGEVEDVPLTELPPLDAQSDGAIPPGGVVGSGVSEGPGAAESQDPDPTIPPAPPAPTAPPTNTPIPAAVATATLPPAPSATAVPTDPPAPTAAPTATPDPAMLRLDDPVLRWLPELRGASAATGVPVALLAALVQVESNGDPNPIGLDDGRGLTGVPGEVLAAQGRPIETWHDPAVNILAGATWLSALVQANGAPEAALIQRWGPNCDALAQCAGLYSYAVLAWERHYAPIVASPETFGIPTLPPEWTAPAISPVQESGPRSIVLPPGVAAPTPNVVPTETPAPTETSVPTEAPLPTEIPAPTDAPAEFESGSSPEA